MRIYDISADIMSAPVYEGDPKPEYKQLLNIKNGDICNLSSISMCLHAATHIDAPRHFIENGKTIEQLDFETLMGECKVIAVFEKELTGEDIEKSVPAGTKRVLLKGYGKSLLTRSAAYVLVSMGVKLVGIDNQTVGVKGDEAEVHKILQLADIIIIEGLDLSEVKSGDYNLLALPLKIKGAEGSPCRALLIKD